MDVLVHEAVAAGKVENAFALGVDGEPVVAVDLLAPGDKGRVQIRVAAPGVVGNHAAVGDDNQQRLRVDPDAALETAVFFVDFLGGDVEDVAIDLVDLLPANVFDVVLGKVFRGEDELVIVLDVLQVGRHHNDAREGVGRGIYDFIQAGAGGTEDDVIDLVPLAVHLTRVVVDGFDAGGAAVGVVVEGLLIFHLLGGKLLNNLFSRNGGRNQPHGPESRVEGHGGEGILALGRSRKRAGNCHEKNN